MYKSCESAFVKCKMATNVSEQKTDVQCPHEPTKCIRSGNTEVPVYACLQGAPTFPQTIYGCLRWNSWKTEKNQ